MQLGTRLVLGLMLATVQTSGTFAEALHRRTLPRSLFRFRRMKVLRAWRAQLPRLTFPRLLISSRRNPILHSVVLHRQRLYSTPFAAAVQTCRAIAAASAKRTFGMFRRTTIQLSRGSPKTT